MYLHNLKNPRESYSRRLAIRAMFKDLSVLKDSGTRRKPCSTWRNKKQLKLYMII